MEINNEQPEEIKIDLKHDNLEFAEQQDGEEPVVDVSNDFEEDEIGADELDALEDDPDNEAAALVATETDLEADDDILPEEDWTDDLPDVDNKENDEEQHRKN